ncbi:MAG TPA: hypothetical protein VMG41_06270 [Gemmatimonadales bacterium]|nr:hypothetical protein [Gemmatimonadales bacterium]
MAHIKTRNPSGGEYSFYSQEEFVRAVRRGAINQDWEVFHSPTGQWLPITAHPAFSPAHADSVTTEVERNGNSELVLIYPPQSRPAPGERPPGQGRDPIDSGPHVTLAEIERVLGSPIVQPNGESAPPARGSSRQSGPVDARTQAFASRKRQRLSIRAVFSNVRVLQVMLLLMTLVATVAVAIALTPPQVGRRLSLQVQRMLVGTPPTPD